MDLTTTLDLELVALETRRRDRRPARAHRPRRAAQAAPARPARPAGRARPLRLDGRRAPRRRPAGADRACRPTRPGRRASGWSPSTTRSSLVVPAAPLARQAGRRRRHPRAQPGGMTNLSGGYLRGLQEARRVAGDHGATLLVLSDGHANARDRRPRARLQALAAGGRRAGVSTSTIGLGLDYDERLLAALADGRRRRQPLRADADAAGAAVAAEVDHLLEQTAQAVSLIIRPSERRRGLHALERPAGQRPARRRDGRARRLLRRRAAPDPARLRRAGDAGARPGHHLRARAALGRADDHDRALATVPVNVNVVPGDVAAGRVPGHDRCARSSPSCASSAPSARPPSASATATPPPARRCCATPPHSPSAAGLARARRGGVGCCARWPSEAEGRRRAPGGQGGARGLAPQDPPARPLSAPAGPRTPGRRAPRSEEGHP